MPHLSDTSYLFKLQFCLSTVPRYATLVVCIALPRRISDSTLQSRLRYASSAVNPRGGIKQSLKFNTRIFTEELIILPRISHTHADRVFLDKFNSPVSLKKRQIRKWLAYHRHTTEFLFYYTRNWEMGHGYIVWDVMLCRWVSGTLHFKGSWCLHLQWLCTPRRTNIEGVIMQTFLGCPLSEPKLTQH